MKRNPSNLLAWYRLMWTIRYFETRVEQLFSKGVIRGTTHPATGQEAVAVGACAAMRKGDLITSTHRGHGHFIARGADPRRMMAELFGKADGYSGGRGGSQLMADYRIGFLGANGITGAGMPVATGAALSLSLRRSASAVLCFFGDGAASQGAFHESLNMASLWKLPVIYLCENNLYAMSTPVRDTVAIARIADRAAGYGIPGVTVDGNDLIVVYDAVARARRRACKGEGPTLVECMTYRLSGHSRGDPRVYRTREEEATWSARDPILRFREALALQGRMTPGDDRQIRKEARQRVREAEQFARRSPCPDPATLEQGVFGLRTLSYTEALREALSDEMRRDPAVILLGEDIGCYGGAFGVTRSLLERFGSRRVINTPISELSFVGAAVGAAMTGSRPVVEIMFMDFVTLAMDPLVNQAAKLRYVFGPQASCPLVLRTVSGGGRCYGPTHSQTLEAWFLHTPGLKIAVPSTPADAAGLLKTAIRDDNPVIFIEHKMLYPTRGDVGRAPLPPIPFGQARRLHSGKDVTIVAWSWMSIQAELAAQQLAAEGIQADVLDLRTLRPLDIGAIVESVRRTGRLVIVEEGCRTGGVSAEIGFQVFEQAFDYLQAPLRRVTTPDVPLSASPSLEQAAIPDAARIASAARELAGT